MRASLSWEIMPLVDTACRFVFYISVHNSLRPIMNNKGPFGCLQLATYNNAYMLQR